MKWRLFHKIFASFLLMSLLLVGLLIVTVEFSASRNFADYVAETELESLDDLIDALSASYVEHQGWSEMKENPRRWYEALRTHLPGDELERPFLPPPIPPGPPFPLQNRPPSEESPGDAAMPGRPSQDRTPPTPPSPDRAPPDGMPPDRPSPDGMPPNRPDLDRMPPWPSPPPLDRAPSDLVWRLSLLDSEKQLVVGTPIATKKAKFREITAEGKIVGWLKLAVEERLSHPLDVDFLKRQSKAIYAIGIGLLVLACILSLLLSKNLAAPIRQLISGTRALASLDFNTRITVRTRDELGQLADDFNSMAQTLRRYEEMRKQWLSDISHEMRTPLSILRGEIEALQDGVRKTDAKALDALHSEVLYISRIVDDLHELALAESGTLRLEKKAIYPIEVLNRAVGFYKDRLAQHRIDVVLELESPRETTLTGDANRLDRLFSNLLENTLRYVDKPGTLTIRSRRTKTGFMLLFDDSGPGVPEASLPRLFDRLYRVDASRSRHIGGSGLGLAICKNIVEAHGGEITALKAPTGGLRIQIVFPLGSAGEKSKE